MSEPVYKVMTAVMAEAFRTTGQFSGAEIDIIDGYIHFSTARQASETLAKHFAGRDGLVLVTVDPDALPETLRWEPARGGDLFPHLYAPLPWGAVRSVDPLPIDADGRHQVPDVLSGTVV